MCKEWGPRVAWQSCSGDECLGRSRPCIRSFTTLCADLHQRLIVFIIICCLRNVLIFILL